VSGIPWGVGPTDGVDWRYVKDCARALALLQTAPTLPHRVYNIGAGQPTRNRTFVDLARAIAPDAPLEPMAATVAAPPALVLDITRLREDTESAP
jgi:UDP-glucose 4-epimerase